MAGNKFDFDIVANDQASKVLSAIAVQMGHLRNATVSLGQAGVASGQSFATGSNAVRQNVIKPLTPLDKLGKNLKTVSFGLSAINAPGATAAARIGMLVKAASKLSEMRKAKIAAASPAQAAGNPFSGLGVMPPPPPPPPPSIFGGAAEFFGGQLVSKLGMFAMGATAAAAALVKIVNAADNFTAKYSGKAQDLVYTAQDIGVSTRFLQQQENAARVRGLAPGVATANIASFGKTVREARGGYDTGAAQMFKMLGVDLGSPWAPRNLESIFADFSKVIYAGAKKSLPQTTLRVLSQGGLGGEMFRVLRQPKSDLVEQLNASAVTADAALQDLTRNAELRNAATRQREATAANIAGKYATKLSDPKQRFLNWAFRLFGPDNETPSAAPFDATAGGALGGNDQSGWRAPLLYKPRPEQGAAQNPAQTPTAQRIDLNIMVPPGVQVRESTPPQSGTNVRIHQSGPSAR